MSPKFSGTSGNTAEKITHKPLVLVVDDEQTICSTLCGVLQDEGLETITALDGPDAIRQVQAHKPDVVFLDIWMPGLDGVETLERIKRFSPETEVIMISGHATIANALEATKRGAFDFIEKPLDIESIMLSLKRAFKRRGIVVPGFEAGGTLSGVNISGLRNAQEGSNSPVLTHPGMLSQGLKGKNRGQRTLKRSTILYGQGLHSGQKSGLVLEPLPANSGLHFAMIGLSKAVPAFVDFVESTGFATTLRYGSTTAATIEHLLAALHAYGVSNLLIKCNGEVPIFDGSAQEFCKIIEDVGIEEQGGEWFEILIDRPIKIVTEGRDGRSDETISIEPSDKLSISYTLEYSAPVGKQEFDVVLDDVESFKREIAPARTFGFMKDIEALQRAGLAAGGRLNNFILIGQDGVINTQLRFENELVRHKILDIMGDLFLLGRPLCAKITAHMTGHSDNIRLCSEIKKLALGMS